MKSLNKIAIIHPNMAARGGAETLIRATVGEMKERGIDATVYTDTIETRFVSDVPQRKVNVGGRFLRWGRGKKRLAAEIETANAVILYHFPAAIHYYFARNELLRQGKTPPKALWYCLGPEPTLYGETLADTRRLRQAFSDSFNLPKLNTVNLDKQAVASLDAVAANSNQTAQFIDEVFDAHAHTVYPGVASSHIVDTMKHKKEPFVLAVSRLEYDRNIFTLLHAFHEYVTHANDARLTLKIVGTGAESDALAETAARLGIAKQVELLGYISYELHDLYTKASAVVHTPTIDPFGMVALEAWASAAPLVLASQSGAAEVASNGKDAALVDGGNPLSIANGLAAVLTNNRFATAIARAGHKRVQDGLTIADHVSGLLDLFMKPAKRKQPANATTE